MRSIQGMTLLTANLEFNPFNPCSFTTEFFSNTDLSDSTDALVVGRYCLPDSYHYMLYKSRDFVPGYSRFARYCLPDSSFCARSPSALSPCSKSITDNPDATDLFFHGFLLRVVRFYAPVGRYDYHGLYLAGGIPRRIGANAIRSKSNIKW